jgi:hypothetical protein
MTVFFVMPGLVQRIDVFTLGIEKTWMAGTKPRP